MVETSKIDTNLYSRQIGTFGMETMGKLIKMKVLIVGMRGLGVECAKNLILAGPNSVDLYDPSPVRINDLGANFYCRESDIGKNSRAQASYNHLQELNSNVNVNVVSTLSLEDHAKYHVVCYTENFDGINNLKQVNAFCHQKGIGFILSETLGLLSYAFTDFGEKHGVSDADGEQCKSFIVSNISNDEQAMVTVHEDKRHSYQEGDFVKFTEVEGMPEINGKGPFELTRATGPHSFKINLDTRNFGEYTRQGLVENVKVTKYISFHDLATSYDNPVASSPDGMLPTVDMRAWGRSDSLHCALRAIHEFHSQHKRYPEIADADAVLQLA